MRDLRPALGAGVLVVAVLAGCRSDGSSAATTVGPGATLATLPPGSTTPGSTTPASAVPGSPASSVPASAVVTPSGFGTLSATVVDASGREREICLWVADTPGLRQRGLMGVTDLGGKDGMVFAFSQPTSGGFWMKDTLLPLSIAFYDGARFVSATDMDPCPPGTDCPTYGSGGTYTHAVEVPQGDLPGLGMLEGSRLTLGSEPCAG